MGFWQYGPPPSHGYASTLRQIEPLHFGEVYDKFGLQVRLIHRHPERPARSRSIQWCYPLYFKVQQRVRLRQRQHNQIEGSLRRHRGNYEPRRNAAVTFLDNHDLLAPEPSAARPPTGSTSRWPFSTPPRACPAFTTAQSKASTRHTDPNDREDMFERPVRQGPFAGR